MKNSNRKEILLLILCFLIGFALRFYNFDQKSLWFDEIHTYNDSRDDLKGQITFYKENPTFLHPPLFFILTHQFYPFSKPERDLRIIPLIFGTLSIPMLYLLARSFSSAIAFPSTLSLTFMAYHISLSQDGRCYAPLMFIGMASLYFLMRHLKTLKKKYLFASAFFFALLFYTSYSSIPFIVLTQLLWFYRFEENDSKPYFSSFLMLAGLTFLLCFPWISFVLLNYKKATIMDPFHTEDPGSLWQIMYGVIHDWAPFLPLMATSTILLVLSPFFLKIRRNALVLLAVFALPIGGLYGFCRLLNITHFITSRYFITFLPIFLITVYLSLIAIQVRFDRRKRFIRLDLLFLFLFITSNLVILPLYYRSEKQNLRGLVTFLKNNLKEGDRIFVETSGYMPGFLHYFGVDPERRHHTAHVSKESEQIVAVKKSFTYQNRTFTLYYSKKCCIDYIADGSRLWIIVGKWTANQIKATSPAVLKGYFDGSFLNFNRFPVDASLYLFLWDPKSPNEKGMNMLID